MSRLTQNAANLPGLNACMMNLIHLSVQAARGASSPAPALLAIGGSVPLSLLAGRALLGYFEPWVLQELFTFWGAAAFVRWQLPNHHIQRFANEYCDVGVFGEPVSFLNGMCVNFFMLNLLDYANRHAGIREGVLRVVASVAMLLLWLGCLYQFAHQADALDLLAASTSAYLLSQLPNKYRVKVPTKAQSEEVAFYGSMAATACLVWTPLVMEQSRRADLTLRTMLDQAGVCFSALGGLLLLGAAAMAFTQDAIELYDKRFTPRRRV